MSKFTDRVKAGIGIGAGKAIDTYYSAKTKNKRRKMIENVARQKVKKRIVGGESKEQLQEDFNKTQRELKKKMKQKGVY